MLLSKEELQLEIKRWQNRLVSKCEICKGVGSVNKPGTNMGIMCSCQEKSILNAYLVAAGLPRKYLNETWNWDGLNNNKNSTEKVKKYSQDFEQNYFNGTGLYIYGRQGRGKSVLESLTLREVANKVNPDTGKKYKVAFMIFEELVKLSHESRADINSGRKLAMIIESPDLLVIDNIGSENGTQAYNTKLLEFILRKRDNNCVPTIISSNFTTDQLISNYSDTVHDFIMQNCEIILVEGDNFRQKTINIDEELMNDIDELEEL